MKKQFLKTKETYDGRQLDPLKNYLEHGLLGDSVVSWQGPCDVSFSHMIDGEDLRDQSTIEAYEMLHFIVEIFHQSLHAGVLLQRLIGELVCQALREEGKASLAQNLVRRGDDLYWQDKKLNVSIATASSQSFLIHFGVNITNEGTPVSTCSLNDFGVTDIEHFAKRVMLDLCAEVESQKRATMKVRCF